MGTKALAAVGSTGTIMFLINGFILGMTAGFTVLTAQKFGAGDMKATPQESGNIAEPCCYQVPARHWIKNYIASAPQFHHRLP